MWFKVSLSRNVHPTDRDGTPPKIPMMRHRLNWYVLAAVLLSIITAWSNITSLALRNRDALVALRILTSTEADPTQVKGFSSPNDQPLVTYVQGLIAYQNGDLQGAETWWAKALQANERYVELVRARANESITLATTAVYQYPRNYIAWDWMGDALRAQAQPEASLSYYLHAVALNPRANLIWEKIGIVAEQVGQLQLALEADRKACDINKIRNGRCHAAARLAYQFSDWQTVVYYFVRGFYPEHPQDWVLLIRAAQHLGQEQDAERYLQMAQQRNPADYEKLFQTVP